VTIDNNTLENDVVTLRERDSMKQITMSINEVVQYVSKELLF